MFDFIASQTGFYVLLSFCGAGAAGALLLRARDSLANWWGSGCAIAGGAWGILFALSVLITGQNPSGAVAITHFPLLSFSFTIDALAAFFILIISGISLACAGYGIGYIRHYYHTYDIGALGFFTHCFLAGMYLVVSASHGLMFLMAWELMSLASYFLVVYDRRDADNVKAGFLYLIMTHVGTACIVAAFLLWQAPTGSFEFDALRAGAALIPSAIKNTIFVLMLIGFGTKAGIIPFHIWLPVAHPAAPSHISALMSGVMIKTGIYMMMRIFLDLLSPIPLWWGLTVLAAGAVSSLLGVLYALTEHDIKRLLANHSIENIGIILLGLGASLTFSSLGMPALALLGFVAALFHTLNHAIFKSLLFLCAGAVISQMHTRNMEEYGGLIKYMPQTALFFLVGSMAISALPPFNGFFSEWLTFQALFQGIVALDFSARWVFILAAGALALTGGLALACFVKAFGAIFLARPRSVEVAHAVEAPWPLRVSMGALAVLSLACGIFSGPLTKGIETIGSNFGVFQRAPAFASFASGKGLAVGGDFALVSGPAFAIFFAVILALVMYITRRVVNARQKVTVGPTWDCGTDLGPRMEITATGFARSLILIFQGVLKSSLQHTTEYHDAESRYLPRSRTVVLTVRDVYQTHLYQPLCAFIMGASARIKNIQSGNINAYILYIFIALVAALFSVL